MVKDKLLRNEQGAETVELAIALPIVFIVCFAVVQLALTLFTSNSLSSQISSASWNINPQELAESSDPNKTVKDTILEYSVGLVPDSLEVTNAQVSFETNNEETALPAVDKNTNLGITEFAHDQTLARIQVDISYDVPSIMDFAGLDLLDLSRHLDHTVIASDRMEVR